MGPNVTISYTSKNGGLRVIDRGVRQVADGWLAVEVHRDATDGHKVAEKLLGGPYGRGRAEHIAGSKAQV
jgi:hypothetical protein